MRKLIEIHLDSRGSRRQKKFPASIDRSWKKLRQTSLYQLYNCLASCCIVNKFHCSFISHWSFRLKARTAGENPNLWNYLVCVSQCCGKARRHQSFPLKLNGRVHRGLTVSPDIPLRITSNSRNNNSFNNPQPRSKLQMVPFNVMPRTYYI